MTTEAATFPGLAIFAVVLGFRPQVPFAIWHGGQFERTVGLRFRMIWAGQVSLFGQFKTSRSPLLR